jgi:hypothetical protein
MECVVKVIRDAKCDALKWERTPMLRSGLGDNQLRESCWKADDCERDESGG